MKRKDMTTQYCNFVLSGGSLILYHLVEFFFFPILIVELYPIEGLRLEQWIIGTLYLLKGVFSSNLLYQLLLVDFIC